jgi:biotin transport system permease protein
VGFDMLSLTFPRQTLLHKIPAWSKLMALCLATSALFLINAPVLGTMVSVLVVSAYAVLGHDFFKRGIGLIWGLWPFIAILVIWHVVRNDYPHGIIIVTRLISAVGLANLVTMTTRLDDMIDCLVYVCRPIAIFGISPKSVGIAIALVIRFIPILIDRAQQLSLAYRARSGKPASWRIIFPLVFTVLDDAERVSIALRARGGVQE